MRDEVMSQLVDRVMTDEEFRSKAREDLDGALADAGFELEDDELEAVRSVHGDMVSLSDDDITATLRRQQGG